MVLRGDAGGCFSMSASPELGKLVRFSDKPLFSVTPRFYYNVDHRNTAKSSPTCASWRPGASMWRWS
jgi:hypothetical protein